MRSKITVLNNVDDFIFSWLCDEILGYVDKLSLMLWVSKKAIRDKTVRVPWVIIDMQSDGDVPSALCGGATWLAEAVNKRKCELRNLPDFNRTEVWIFSFRLSMSQNWNRIYTFGSRVFKICHILSNLVTGTRIF